MNRPLLGFANNLEATGPAECGVRVVKVEKPVTSYGSSWQPGCRNVPCLVRARGHRGPHDQWLGDPACTERVPPRAVRVEEVGARKLKMEERAAQLSELPFSWPKFKG